MDAYASVVSNNLNIIMKVLTVITIIMTIPNIIFGHLNISKMVFNLQYRKTTVQ